MAGTAGRRTATTGWDEILRWYLGQDRVAVRWHRADKCFRVHSRADGSAGAAPFATYYRAVIAAYDST